MKKFKIVTYFIIVISIILLSCSYNQTKNKINSNKISIKENSYKLNEIDKNEMVKIEAENNPKTQNDSYNTDVNQSLQSSSGKITTVPWGNDIKFKATQEKNNSFILMAAYKTVLRDPLPGEEYNVHHAARLLAGTIVNPGEIFPEFNRTLV